MEVCKLTKRDPLTHEMINRLQDKNLRSEEGKTPLDFATIAVHLNLRQFNIENAKEDHKDTLLHLAAENGRLEVCVLIIGQFVEKVPFYTNPSNLYRKEINLIRLII